MRHNNSFNLSFFLVFSIDILTYGNNVQSQKRCVTTAFLAEAPLYLFRTEFQCIQEDSGR